MNRNEQKERRGEREQQPATQGPIERPELRPPADRRRFLKTGAAYAAGSAVAYSMPTIAQAQIQNFASPICPVFGVAPLEGAPLIAESEDGSVLYYEMTEQAAQDVESSEFFVSTVSSLAARGPSLIVRTDKPTTTVFPALNSWNHTYLLTEDDGNGERLAGMLQIYPVDAGRRYDGLFFGFSASGGITMTAPTQGIVLELQGGDGSIASIGADLDACMATADDLPTFGGCYQRCLDCVAKHSSLPVPQTVIDDCSSCFTDPGLINCASCLVDLSGLEIVGAVVAGCVLRCICRF